MTEIGSKDFQKLNIRIGQIKAAKKHPKTKDYILLISLGPAGTDKQLIADLSDSYTMDQLIGKQVVFIQNYEPSIVNGIETIGLLLTTRKGNKTILIKPEIKVETGVKVGGRNNTLIEHHENLKKPKCK